jgi:hypothetical protein
MTGVVLSSPRSRLPSSTPAVQLARETAKPVDHIVYVRDHVPDSKFGVGRDDFLQGSDSAQDCFCPWVLPPWASTASLAIPPRYSEVPVRLSPQLGNLDHGRTDVASESPCDQRFGGPSINFFRPDGAAAAAEEGEQLLLRRAQRKPRSLRFSPRSDLLHRVLMFVSRLGGGVHGIPTFLSQLARNQGANDTSIHVRARDP